jgi:tetratricopeptide (TPR) repeat protein
VFARALYTGLLTGDMFGDAVLYARKATHEAYRNSNTWAAYQCYGNPDFSLSGKRATRGPDEHIRRSRREYLDAVRNIKSDAESKSDPERYVRLLEELREIDRKLPEQWRDGQMLAEMGDAYTKLADFARAIEVYESAISQENAEAPICTLERLANTLDRYSTGLMVDMKNHEDAASMREYAAEQTAKAIKYLEWLLGLSETAERLSLLGGAYKRKARTDATTRADSLRKSADYYRRAHEMGKSGLYPTLNYLTMAYLADPANRKALLPLLEQAVAEAAKAAAENATDRWARVGVPDAAVVEALISGGEIDSETLIEKYNRAIKGEGDARYLASIRGQIEMIAELEPVRQKSDALERIAAALRGV